MDDYLIKGETLTQIADAIRAKTGGTEKISPGDMPAEIEGISGAQGNITINGVVEQYKVNARATVNAGDFVEFVNEFGGGQFTKSAISYISAVQLDNSRVLAAYRDPGNSGYVMAVVLVISETGVTVGTPTLVSTTMLDTYKIATLRLSENKVMAVFGDASVYAVILVIDGATIEVGKYITVAGNNGYFVATTLNDSKVLVAYYGGYSSNYYYSQISLLSVDGTTITKSTTATYDTRKGSSASPEALVALDSERAVLVYAHSTGTYSYLFARPITISGTATTIGAEVDLKSEKVVEYTGCRAAVLSDDRILLVYQPSTSYASNWRAMILSFNTDITITVVTSASGAADASTSGLAFPVALSDTNALIVYSNANASSKGCARVLTIDGTTITMGANFVFDANASYWPCPIAFSGSSALVLYRKGAGGSYTTLTIDGTTITASDAAEFGTFVQPATSRAHNVGVAKTGGTEGSTVDVYMVSSE